PDKGRFPDGFRRLQPQRREPLSLGQGEYTLAIDREQDHRRAVDDVLEPLLALAECLFDRGVFRHDVCRTGPSIHRREFLTIAAEGGARPGRAADHNLPVCLPFAKSLQVLQPLWSIRMMRADGY